MEECTTQVYNTFTGTSSHVTWWSHDQQETGQCGFNWNVELSKYVEYKHDKHMSYYYIIKFWFSDIFIRAIQYEAMLKSRNNWQTHQGKANKVYMKYIHELYDTADTELNSSPMQTRNSQ